MRTKYIFSFLAFFLFVNVLLSQTVHVPGDIVYMKNGSVFYGRIMEYTQGKELKIKLSTNGTIVTLKDRKVKKIIQGNVKEPVYKKIKRTRKPYQFKEKGLYNATYLTTNMGGSAFDATETDYGYGMQTSFGYQFHRLIGVGAGIGMDYYYKGSGENFMPVFGEVRGYLFPKNITPTYSFAAGYGFAFKDEDRNIIEADGGLMIHPAVGIRFGGDKNMNFTLDAGVKIQKGRFVFRNWEVIENRMTYKRFVIRAGLLF